MVFMFYILSLHLFSNWKCVPFDHLHPILLLTNPCSSQYILSSAFRHSRFCLFGFTYMIIQYLSSSCPLISSSIMPSKSTHVITNGKTAFLWNHITSYIHIHIHAHHIFLRFPGAQMVKNFLQCRRHRFSA